MSAIETMCDAAATAQMAGRYDDAETLFRKAVALARAEREPRALTYALNGLGGNLRFQGRFEAALEVMTEHAEIARRLGGPDEMAVSLANRAALLREIAAEAEPGSARASRLSAQAGLLLDEHEPLCRATGNLASLQMGLGIRALLQRDSGLLQAARNTMTEQADILGRTGDTIEAARCHSNLAMLNIELCDFPEAVQHLDEAERLSAGVTHALLAQILQQIRRIALPVAHKSFVARGEMLETYWAHDQAGDDAEAAKILETLLRMAPVSQSERLGYTVLLGASLANAGRVEQAVERYDQALAMPEIPEEQRGWIEAAREEVLACLKRR